MTIKTTDGPLPLDIKKPAAVVRNDNKDFVFEKVLFGIEALSALQSLSDSSDSVGSKSASVKFMITIQDEADLQNLGFSKEQIDKLKPQEAEDILKSGTKAELTSRQE